MISYLIEYIFVYGVDCMINLANLTGLSYYEVNALVFCIAWPMLTVGLFLVLALQKARLARIRGRIKTELLPQEMPLPGECFTDTP